MISTITSSSFLETSANGTADQPQKTIGNHDSVLNRTVIGEAHLVRSLKLAEKNGKSDANIHGNQPVETHREESKIGIHLLPDLTQYTLYLLTKDSSFFNLNPPRPLPRFFANEVHRGRQLGQGEFGTVWEIIRFTDGVTAPVDVCQDDTSVSSSFEGSKQGLQDKPFDKPDDLKTKKNTAVKKQLPTSASCERSAEKYTRMYGRSNTDIFASSNSIPTDRDLMICISSRNGVPRYAMKRIRYDILEKCDSSYLTAAMLDLALEALFLQSLNHNNICKIRATCGEPGSPDFSIIIDCMAKGTLSSKLEQWRETKKILAGGILRSCMAFRDEAANIKLRDLQNEQLMAVHDIANGMKYLHSKNVIFRDLKPENLGFNVRGDVRIFDFGLAKELRREDMVQPPNGYQATFMAGTPRYMAPEVYLGLPYGLPADVYSFSILLWQVFALETPFTRMAPGLFVAQVIIKGFRPRRFPGMSKNIRKIVTASWAANPNKRLCFEEIFRKMSEDLVIDEAQWPEDRSDKSIKASFQNK